jgi:hypothetical protein
MAAATKVNEIFSSEDESGLRAHHIAELRWFWNGDMEAACGVQSNFGAMCERLALYHGAEDEEERREKAKDARRGFRKAVDAGEAIDVDKAHEEIVRLALVKPSKRTRGPIRRNGLVETGEPMSKYMHVGSGHQVPWKCLGQLKIEDPGQEPRVEIVMTLADPGDHAFAVKRSGRIRAALKAIALEHTLTLYAVYGPSRGMEDETRTIRKRCGALTEVVVGLAGDRHEVYKRLCESEYVADLKRRATGMLREAGSAYAEARRA